MRKYVVKRILLSVLILICVTFIIYGLLRCLPSSYVENMAMQLSSKPGAKSYDEWLGQLNASYGLDKGIIPGYFTWLGDAIQGKFGDSWKYTVPVTTKFSETIWLSFIMGLISFALELVIAIPLGIIAATKQYSRADYAITTFSLVGISLPTFFFATLLKLGDAKKVISRVPVGTILMIAGVSFLMSIAKEAGMIEVISAAFGSGIPKILVAPLFCILGGVLSLFASGTSVVLPLLFPMVPALAAATGLNPVALYAAAQIGALITPFSPFSSAGAQLIALAPNSISESLVRRQFVVALVTLLFCALLTLLGICNIFRI